MGVNAHINYDLVFTLFDMLHVEWWTVDAKRRAQRYEDHCKVNEIIAATIDSVQDDLLTPADPVMGWIDKAFGRADEYLLSVIISNWRKNAWGQACDMIMLKEENQREALRLSIENSVLKRNRLISLTL